MWKGYKKEKEEKKVISSSRGSPYTHGEDHCPLKLMVTPSVATLESLSITCLLAAHRESSCHPDAI